MSNHHLTMTVFFEAKPNKSQELKLVLSNLVKPTLAEAGCLHYELHESPENPHLFMIYEIWQNKEAHTQHSSTAHIQAWRKVKDDLLATPVKSSIWQIVKS